MSVSVPNRRVAEIITHEQSSAKKDGSQSQCQIGEHTTTATSRTIPGGINGIVNRKASIPCRA